MKLLCDSCRRLGGVERIVDGTPIVCCDDCAESAFRVERCVERARAVKP